MAHFCRIRHISYIIKVLILKHVDVKYNFGSRRCLQRNSFQMKILSSKNIRLKSNTKNYTNKITLSWIFHVLPVTVISICSSWDPNNFGWQVRVDPCYLRSSWVYWFAKYRTGYKIRTRLHDLTKFTKWSHVIYTYRRFLIRTEHRTLNEPYQIADITNIWSAFN